MKKLLAIACLLAVNPCVAQVYTKNNGPISVELNRNYPMITSFSIGGAVAVPNDNAGADFQMTVRSAAGNAYNPTQGGDCVGNPSVLTGVIQNWSGSGLGVAAANGILLGVSPRNYNEPNGCLGAGPVLPYNFNFGLTLGDGIKFPPEMMVVDMSVKKNSGAQDIVKNQSELPVAFPYSGFMRYAFYADANNNIAPFGVSVNGTTTNDITLWPYTQNFGGSGKAVILCSDPTALSQPSIGRCMAFYSDFVTTFLISHRHGANNDLSYMTLLGSADGTATISDMNWHTLRRWTMVGNIGTIQSLMTVAGGMPTSGGAGW